MCEAEAYGPAACEEGRNVLFPGKTVSSKIVVHSTSAFEPLEQVDNYLVLDVWELEQTEISAFPEVKRTEQEPTATQK